MTSPERDPNPNPEPDPFAGPDWGGDAPAVAPGTPPHRHRRRRVSRRRLRRRRRYGIALMIVGAIILLGGAWVLITGLLARSQLSSVRAEVHQLRSQISAGNLDGARNTARQITDHASKADSYTSGPAWAIAANIPAGGAPFETVRTITRQVDVLGRDVLPQVITATHQLDPSTLRRPDGTINLSRIQAVSPGLHTADRTMTRATAQIADRPQQTWLGPVDSARDDLLTQMRSLGHTLHSADLAARIAPQMLGADGVKRYFIGFQNDAEARGTGGLPGAFAIVRADHGKITFERFESDSALTGVKTGLDFGQNYDHLWSVSEPTTDYGDSNASPHFPYAAQIWLAMWQRKSGEKLDGALAVDPTALSYLLAVTGPATLPDKSRATSRNVVQLTQKTVYARYPTTADAGKRRAYLLGVARAVSHHILETHGNTTALVKAAGKAGAQRRLLVYSTDSGVESDLEQTSLSGAVPATSGPFLGLVVNNDAGNKLDYYLDRSLTWQRTGCGSQREVTATIRLTNDAPLGLPSYVTGRADHPTYPVKVGDNRLGVYYYATDGAFLVTGTLDGKPIPLVLGKEQGHPVYGADVEMPRGKTRTLVLHFLEPAGKGDPVVLRQPLVRPLHVKVDDQHCG